MVEGYQLSSRLAGGEGRRLNHARARLNKRRIPWCDYITVVCVFFVVRRILICYDGSEIVTGVSLPGLCIGVFHCSYHQ